MDQLDKLRQELGACDDKIIDALLERNRIVEKIMAFKESHDMQILQPQQEEKQLNKLEKKLKGKPHQEQIYDVFHSINQNSKRIQARHLFNYNIFLIGFMGSGKTTISEFLNTMFAMNVVEMDKIIAQRANMSISDIFEVYGEEHFRNMETELVIEMQRQSDSVISCGGGTPMREENVQAMKENGKVVLLTASPETVYERVKDSHDRPVIENNKNVPFIAELMEKRRQKYEAAADIIIGTDGKTELEICEELIQKLMELEG